MHKLKPGQNVKVYLHALKSHFTPLPLPPPPPPISLLPLFLPSPMPYNSPSSSLITLSLSQLLSPLIYHCQYDPLTLHKTKKDTPPSLLSKYHYHLLNCLNLYIHNAMLTIDTNTYPLNLPHLPVEPTCRCKLPLK